jgi:hypothetical protein
MGLIHTHLGLHVPTSQTVTVILAITPTIVVVLFVMISTQMVNSHPQVISQNLLDTDGRIAHLKIRKKKTKM